MSTKYAKVKRCRVCGDSALSFNLNGLCCEPCKSFFRRNAPKIEQLHCVSEGKCSIDKYNRKSCSRCRIEKCLDIGMKMESIENHSMSHRAYDQAQIAHVRGSMTVFGNDNCNVEFVGQVDTHLQAINLGQLFVERTVKLGYKFASFASLRQSDQLILLKWSHTEILTIYTAFTYDKTRAGIPVLLDAEKNTAVLWTAVFTFPQLKAMGVDFRQFIHTMRVDMENDATIRDLIVVLLLFKPRPKLSCHEFISYNHIFYCHLLRRHLQHKYAHSPARAIHKFSTIMSMLHQMSAVTKMMQQMYTSAIASMELDKVAHVLAEIYNLL